MHESPSLASRYHKPLLAGQVVTVEPGIYLPGRFGVRIEDFVLVTPDGCDNLTRSAKGQPVNPSSRPVGRLIFRSEAKAAVFYEAIAKRSALAAAATVILALSAGTAAIVALLLART